MEGIEYEAHVCPRDRQKVIHPRSEMIPTSTVQRQFWLLHQLAPDSAAYNIPYAFRIRGRLNVAALRRSLQEIVNRHEAFRTCFGTQGDQLVQKISNDLTIDVPTIDLDGLTPEEADDTLREIIGAEAMRPFDLSRGPLLRTVLLRQSDDEHVFVLAMHHIITDLHSINALFRELSTLYDAHSVGAPCPLERPSCQYSDYALWEQQWLQGDEAASMLSYWEQELQGREGLLSLPTDRPRPAVQSMAGDEIPLQIAPALSAELRQFNRRTATPFFVTLLSAYVVLLHRYSGQPSIIVGVPFTNRRQCDFREIMGCLVNILPIRVDLSDNPSFRQVTQRLRQTMLAAHRCQEVTVESIVERLKLGRNLSYNPLYQVGATHIPPVALSLRDLTVEPLKAPTLASQLDLFLSLWEADGEFRGRIEFYTDLFERATMERFIRDYEALLESAVADADSPIGALSILPKPNEHAFCGI